MSNKKYRQLTPEQKAKANIRNKRWKEKNRHKVIEYKKRHYAQNRDKYLTIERNRQYIKRYGITIDDYNRMFNEQNGKCAICGSETAGQYDQAFAVDHCHNTLKVRGLLCIKCNARLGWYEANKTSIKNYLND